MATQEQFCANCGAANTTTARFCQYCAAPLPFRPSTGALPEQTLLNGRYQLETRIGQGGMGAVYKATDTRFNNRPVAIKEMSNAGLSEGRLQEAEDAFERESHLLSDLLHPNLPRIYDHFAENDRSYLVMDFIEGESLEDYVERANGSPMPLDQVLTWGEELCDVLTYLHNHQPPIVFRDLKPSNVMISNGHIFLIDFGIARIFKPGQSHDTTALGSPGFAAPEQYGKAQSTPRSDIYSLGALLHSLLTGVDPSEQPFFFRPASQLNPAVSPALENLLQRMLDMDSDRRPASAQEVAAVLRNVQHTGGTMAYATTSMPSLRASMAPPAPPPSHQMLQDAYHLYSQHRLNEAATKYDQALRLDNGDAQAWQGRGLTMAMLGKHREALDAFDHALKIDSSLVISLNGKGTALNMLHRNQEALDVFDRAAMLEPDNAVSWNGKGAVLSALGKADQALNAFDVALHFDPHMAQAWGNKGLVLRQMHRYSEALRAFEEALTYDRHAITYMNGKGMVLFEMGRFKEALSAFQEALGRNNNYAPAWYGIGNVLYAQRQLRGALDAYERSVKADPRFVKALDRRGNVLADIERPYKALESYAEALRIDPRYAPAWNSKGSVLCQLERYEEALESYNQAVILNPSAALAWNGKGNAFYHLHNFDMALDSYNRALSINPRMISALHNKSLVLKQLKRYEEALTAAEAAIRVAPNDPDNWQRKAEALRKLRRGRDARAAEAEMTRLRSIA
ncbi:MAG TPA: tetratricopeptide repeat protein [Ktedonobacteraceae bacterium]|jgi:tetratricopeptide (TPR) repeat protein|nr:tetratricopeptide repeat protein [Ktedonobacteraceae bacterium]